MTHTQRVVKNSFWLIAQPLLLNIISLFVIGYVVRTLGQVDYGKYTFAFTIVTMTMSILNIGLCSLIAREIAEDREKAPELFGNILVLRMLLALIIIVVICASVNLLHYPETTKIAVYIYSILLFSYAFNSTAFSLFQGVERMEYVALVQFVSGFVLTILSVAVLFLGFRLNGFVTACIVGNIIGTGMAIYYATKLLPSVSLRPNIAIWKEYLGKGLPFFLPGVVTMFGNKLGIIILSKMSGDVSVGVFGAAYVLLERFIIIPDGICTAIFPTIASLYTCSKEDAARLFERFFRYLFILGLPIAVGISVLAAPIIRLIYGNQYLSVVPVMQILAWWLFFQFLDYIQSWSLGAIHQEKKVAQTNYFYAIFFLIINILLVPFMKEVGLSLASAIASAILFMMLFPLTRKHLDAKFLSNVVYAKTIVASAVMGFSVYMVRDRIAFVGIGLGMVSYGALILLLKVITAKDILQLIRTVTRHQSPSESPAKLVGKSMEAM